MNLGIPILDAQNEMEESQSRFKFYHFRAILSLKTSVEQWLPGLLLWTPCLWGLENSLKPQFQKRKIELSSYHCPNYFFSLAPVYQEEKQSFFFFFHNFKFLHDLQIKHCWIMSNVFTTILSMKGALDTFPFKIETKRGWTNSTII